MKTKKIIITVSNDLVSDNRVHKIATTLHENGYKVLLLGRLLKNSLPIKRNYKTKRFRLIFNKKALFYAELNIRFFIFLLFSKNDIFLSNDLDTLPAVFFAAKIRKKVIVFDSHEIFPEVPELVIRPNIQKIWLKIEAFLLPKIKYSYTVCNSIAEYYKKKYGINMQVIRNVPFYQKKAETRKPDIPIIQYQGAVNIGRGIELTIKAMQYINNAKLRIIGNGDIFDDMKKLASDLQIDYKVEFTGRVPLEQIPELTKQATLGLSIEENLGLNYYFALPNKLFDYIQAGVPVLCSNFPEMRNIIKKYNIGFLIESRDEKKFAGQIKEILKNLEKKNQIFNNIEISKKELSWEKEQKKLLQIIDSIIY
jgi:glycosyltransferase involved in cell wall biosynthesis